MNRPAPRLALLLAGAAVPVMLIAGCSSGSGSSNSQSSGAPSGSTANASGVAPAKFTKLPDACKALSADTVNHLVPSAKNAGGSSVSSGDPKNHGGCSWTGLDGYQYRFLDTSLQRFDSIANAGSAEDLAKTGYQAAATTAAKASAAKSAPVSGVGDQATLITWDANKDNTDYHYATVIARTSNVVISVDFSGAGLQGDNKPKTDEMDKDTQLAAKEAVAAVAATASK